MRLKKGENMPRILKIDRAFYEVDEKTGTYRYHGRNPNWKSLSRQENQKNKRYIDGYTRMFPDGRKKVFKYRG
jgi:hypothetical protein